MIDIHTHILPGVDDGVKTEDDAVEFARVAAGDGVRVIVATPHCREGFFVNERPAILGGVARLRARLAREGLPIELLPGAEVHLSANLVERVRDGRATTLGNNGKTLLLELSTTQYPVELENLVFQLKLAGIVTVFAHPERIKYFQEDVRRLEAVIRLGSFGQLTTGSLLGTFGREVRDFSTEILRRGLVQVLASDAHGVRGRPPVLSSAVEAAGRVVGEDLARRMADEFPRALLEGREPEWPSLGDADVPPKRSIFGRWFRRGTGIW